MASSCIVSVAVSDCLEGVGLLLRVDMHMLEGDNLVPPPPIEIPPLIW